MGRVLRLRVKKSAMESRRLTKKRILVGGRDNVKLSCGRVVTQPTPARALDGGNLRIKFRLELIEATKVTINGLFQCAVRKFSTTIFAGGQILPEKRVVDMTYPIM